MGLIFFAFFENFFVPILTSGGYVGLSIATLLSQHHKVMAVDIVPEKVELINNKKSPIQDEYIEKYLAEKELDLTATLDAKEAYSDADFVVIAAPTNYDSKKNFFDTSAVEAVIKLVIEYNPEAIMVIKSTIPVGFTASVREKYHCDNIIFSPEFLRESKALYDNLYPSRIIVGTDVENARLVKAAQSHVQVSFDAPEYSGDVDALGVLRVLEAVRVCGLTKTCKVYQASTSELYGKVEEVPQRETTPFHPYSPYAVAKQYGFWMVKEYRDAYGMFAVNGILFNHESERRGENFVTRKITLAAGRIAEGLQDHLELGNMDSLRDWGYAKDYVECMWLIMQQEKPDDFVIATGVQHTVRDFTEKAFAANGITIRWEGTGIDEKGYDAATGKMLVCVNPQWFRPTDVDNLWGDPTKAKTVLGWNPQSTTYEQLVEIMAKHDRERAKREKALKAVL